VLAGWSRGGKAAAGLGLVPEEAGGWRPSAVVCLASGFTRPDPITRTSPLDLAKGAAQAPPFFVVHGTADPVVPITQARQFAATLAGRGHRVQLRECPTDHAGVILAEYETHEGICQPATSSHAAAAGRLSAQTLLEAAAF
jgi:predicted esterase